MTTTPKVTRLKGHTRTLEHNGERTRSESAWTATCVCGWQDSASTKAEAAYEYRQHLRRSARQSERRTMTTTTHHPSATHTDANGMPVAGTDTFPFHPTPCCGAAASINDGPMYCKACYREVDFAYGGVPVKPFIPRGER